MVAGKLSVILRWKEHVKPVLVDMGLGDFPPPHRRETQGCRSGSCRILITLAVQSPENHESGAVSLIRYKFWKFN